MKTIVARMRRGQPATPHPGYEEVDDGQPIPQSYFGVLERPVSFKFAKEEWCGIKSAEQHLFNSTVYFTAGMYGIVTCRCARDVREIKVRFGGSLMEHAPK